MDNQIVEYSINEAEISKMADIYMNLTVEDLDDNEGLASVHAARMVMVKHRTAVDKLRKSANENAQAFIKNNNANAKKLLDLMEPIELHLKTEEEKVVKELERIKAEQDRIQKEITQKRLDDLLAVNVVMPFFDVATMDDNTYETLLDNSTHKYKAEQLRVQEETRAREEAEAKLATERAELERVRAEQEVVAKAQAEKERALQADVDRLIAAKRAEQERKDREEFEKEADERARIKAEADAKAKVEADALREKERIEREAREKKEREEAEAAEKIRLAELAPDKEKLILFAGKINLLADSALILKSKKAKHLFNHTINKLTIIETDFLSGIKEL